MRKFLFLFLPAAAFAADLQVDHATVCGMDVKKMQAALKTAGMTSEYGGPHNNHASEMALTSFPDGSYLEQIAIQPQGDPKAIAEHEWSKQMKGNAGPCAWAVRANDVTTAGKRIGGGITAGAPVRAGRNRPDGTRLDWETMQIGSMTRGTFFPFLIHDFTPREARAFPSGKPTTADFSGVAKIVIAVRDLDAAVAQYRRAYNLPEPKRQTDASFGTELASFEGTPVILAGPANPQSWIGRRVQQFGDGPCALILKAAKPPSSGSVWFGTKVSWMDAAKLGWHLGVE